jgi:hypothetical protein
VFVLGRVPVRVNDQVIRAVVRDLKRSPRVDVDETSAGDFDPLRRFTQVHRERAFQHDEGLLLKRMPVAAPLRTRLVAPEVGSRMGELRQVAQLGDVPGGLAFLVGTSDPAELVG